MIDVVSDISQLAKAERSARAMLCPALGESSSDREARAVPGGRSVHLPVPRRALRSFDERASYRENVAAFWRRWTLAANPRLLPRLPPPRLKDLALLWCGQREALPGLVSLVPRGCGVAAPVRGCRALRLVSSA